MEILLILMFPINSQEYQLYIHISISHLINSYGKKTFELLVGSIFIKLFCVIVLYILQLLSKI